MLHNAHTGSLPVAAADYFMKFTVKCVNTSCEQQWRRNNKGDCKTHVAFEINALARTEAVARLWAGGGLLVWLFSVDGPVRVNVGGGGSSVRISGSVRLLWRALAEGTSAVPVGRQKAQQARVKSSSGGLSSEGQLGVGMRELETA